MTLNYVDINALINMNPITKVNINSISKHAINKSELLYPYYIVLYKT